MNYDVGSMRNHLNIPVKSPQGFLWASVPVCGGHVLISSFILISVIARVNAVMTGARKGKGGPHQHSFRALKILVNTPANDGLSGCIQAYN